MRYLTIATAALLAVTAVSALAQTPAVMDPSTGARPGHTPGVGESLPKSDKASNILPGAASGLIAPTLPSPAIGDTGAPNDYLRAARASLAAGRTGQAQQALEMAETRSLDRAIAPGQVAMATQSRFVTQIADARRALGGGDIARAMEFIDLALAP